MTLGAGIRPMSAGSDERKMRPQMDPVAASTPDASVTVALVPSPVLLPVEQLTGRLGGSGGAAGSSAGAEK